MDFLLIKNLFTEIFGFDLDSKLEELGEELDGERFIYRQNLILESYIRKYNITFDYGKLNDERKDDYNKILVEQVYFSLTNGDISAWNGIDQSSGQVVEKVRFLSPLVEDLVYSKGFKARARW